MSSSPAPVIYCRLSRDKTGAGIGVDRQERECRELAERLGWTVSRPPYVDNDVSAYSGRARKNYRRLLVDIAAGEVSAVLCWHTDRLHRSPIELEEWITLAESHRVNVHTVKAGPIDLATPSGRAVARTLGAWARYESEHRGERVSAAMDEIARKGGVLGGGRKFGWSKELQLDSEEAQMVRDATRALLAGRSLRSIVRAWNGTSIRTSLRSQDWTGGAVRDVLTRARNAGLVEHRGQIVGPGQWPAIVTESEWRAVCMLLADPKRRTSPGNQPRWLGSLLYRCGVCDGTLFVGTSGGPQRKSSYRCRTSAAGSDGRRHVARAAQPLDDFVSRVLVDRLSRPDATGLFVPKGEPGEDLDAVHSEVDAIDIRRTELAARFGAGEITTAMLDAGNGPLLARMRTLKATLAEATTVSPIADLVADSNVAERWPSLALDVRRAVLAELATVTIMPGRPGRQPDGGYFDPSSVKIEWITTPGR